jgi:hypothetical protein
MTVMSAWKKCSSCRSDIGFGETYYVCSVSTCQRSRTALYFCRVSCWDAHLATANHREAWAEDKRAPSQQQWEAEQAAATADTPPPRKVSSPPQRQMSSSSSPRRVVAPAPAATDDLPKDILIVVSKLKKYIKARSGMKTSDTCSPVLSDFVRKICDQAIRRAGEAERKTVMDRDFDGLF